ncbi:P-type conjugative transfer protein TrbG [Sphingomonas sp. ASV193]|uniref:P-type conjugative transfer protein TrbG n=1 Tax=Sphingomonas sp. ASV193 TaxID=3144405 RepID=UPI0032E8DB2D
MTSSQRAVMAALALLLPGLAMASPRVPHAASARPSAIDAVRRANRSATREPGPAGYVEAAQIYPWSEGARFRLYAAPGQVSDIALQAGEALVSVAAGDTLRWIIGDTTSGSGSGQRTHILVKPAGAGLVTNLLIATDRRIYHVDLISTAATAMTGIAWTYPGDGLILLRTSGGSPPVAVPPVEALNFNYRISGDHPAWRPVRAFDDGRQLYIEFPPRLAAGEAPPLFMIGIGGRAELVNYRQRGHYYVVDRLVDRAELRLGEHRQQVVRIERTRIGGRR